MPTAPTWTATSSCCHAGGTNADRKGIIAMYGGNGMSLGGGGNNIGGRSLDPIVCRPGSVIRRLVISCAGE